MLAPSPGPRWRFPRAMSAPLVVPGIESLPAIVGREFGPSSWLTIDQARIDAFAQATGDNQWIHLDAERAERESPFGQTVAHGYLTLALAPVLLAEIFEVKGCTRVINAGIDKLKLRLPVPSGSRIRLEGQVLSARRAPGGAVRVCFDLKWLLEGAERPACQGEAVYVYSA
jgi:acyl dehydratase